MAKISMLPELNALNQGARKCANNIPIRLNWTAWEARKEMARRGRKGLRRESFELQKEMVEGLASVMRQNREVYPMMLVGVFAKRLGLEGEHLRRIANALSVLSRDGIIDNRTFARSLWHIAKENLPVVVDSRLMDEIWESNPVSLTIDDLTRKVYGEEVEGSERSKIEYMGEKIRMACNLLEVLNLAYRLPSDSTLGHNNYRWIHERLRKTPASIPEWNLPYGILLALEQYGRMKESDLMRHSDLTKVAIPFKSQLKEGDFLVQVRGPLSGLLNEDLIEMSFDIGASGRRLPLYSATARTKELLRETKARGYLAEDLRVGLLGVKDESNIDLSRELRIRRHVKRIRVLMEAEKGEGRVRIIARRLDEKSESFVSDVLRKGLSAWRISQTLLKDLEAMKKDPTLSQYAEWLEVRRNITDQPHLPGIVESDAIDGEEQDNSD
jgi:hypothetical protein